MLSFRHKHAFPSFSSVSCLVWHHLSLSLFRIIYVLLLVAVVCWLALDTAKLGTRQLVSFAGLLCLIFLMMLFSKHPFRVKGANSSINMQMQKVRTEFLIICCTYIYVAVVLANFALWGWVAVCLWSAGSQNYIWI